MSGGIVGVATPDPGTNALIQRLANPPNPLATLGQDMSAITALKEYQAQNALTGIYQQSIDPATGQVDLGKFNALASQNPAALWKFGQTMQSAGTGVGNEGQGTSAQLNARLDQLGAQAAYMTPLIAKAQAGTVTADDVRSVLKDIPPGVIPPSTLASVNQQLNDGADPNNVVRGAFFANQHGRDILSTALGPVATVNQGPQTTFVRPAAPFAPGGVSSSPLPMGLTPDGMLKLTTYLNESYTYTDKQGRVHPYPTKMAFYNELGINPFKMFTDGTIPAPGTPPPVLPMAAPGSTGPVSTVTTGRAPVAPAAPGLPGGPGGGPAEPAAAPPVPPVSPQPGGNLESPTSPSAALPENTVATGRKAYDLAQTNQQNLPLQLQPLHNAMVLLKTNPDLQTGAGQAQWAHAITSIAAALNINVPQGSTDLQELTKYLVQNVRAQETGGSTDLDRLQTEAANPNPTTQSRDALQVLLAKQIGVTRLQSAALDYFNSKYPDAQTAAVNSGRFNIDTTDWKKKQDPTAWAADDLAPEQVARYFQGLNGSYDSKTGTATGDKAAFINSLRDARQIGKVRAGATTGPASEPPPLPPGVP